MMGMQIRLYPTKVQLEQIKNHIDTSRFVYNHMLARRLEAYKTDQTTIGKYDLMQLATAMKHTEEYDWLKNVHSQTLQTSILNLDTAFKNFYRKVKQGNGPKGFPRFKSKKNPLQSFQYPQGVHANSAYSKLYLPKIGYVKCRGYRSELTGNIKTVTIKVSSSGRVSASLLIAYEPIVQPNTNTNYIGLDVGTNKFVTDSTGVLHQPLDLTRPVARIKHLQKMLANMITHAKNKQGISKYDELVLSNNVIRTQSAIAKQFEHITNKRDNYVHHIANKYLQYRIVYVEDLNIRDMLKSTVGTEDNPNYQSRQDARLHNLVSRQAWGKFFTVLEYKLARRKSGLVRVPPAYTSQMCSSCGAIDKKSRNRESYTCTSCGHHADADVNAAMNIAHIGRTQILAVDTA